MLKIKSIKEESPEYRMITSYLVDALHGQAAAIAQDIGEEVFAQEDGYKVLIQKLKENAFPGWTVKRETYFEKVKNSMVFLRDTKENL